MKALIIEDELGIALELEDFKEMVSLRIGF